METPNTYYTNNIKRLDIEVANLKKYLFGLSVIRLTVFLGVCIAIYSLLPHWQIALVVGGVGALLFIFILSKFTDKKADLSLKKALLNLNKEELKIQSGDFFHRDSGQHYHNPKHAYSYDIDLFGRGSFFQYMNRTALKSGTDELAKLLTENNIQDIVKRQHTIKELAKHIDWMQLYIATGNLIHSETSTNDLMHWLKSYTPVLPSWMKWMPWCFSSISIILLILGISEVISLGFFAYWILVGLGISGLYVKKINVLASNCDKAKATFKQYASLLEQIEAISFSSELLKEKQNQIQSNHKKASTIVAEFSKHIDALDNRNNLIGAVFGNGYLLSDIRNAYKVEQWIAANANCVEDWFEVVTFFDAFNSLGVYAFNHPVFVFPQITSNSEIINAKNLGHPMLSEDKRVTSDVVINNTQFFIVTGANMAGKSTFLRTVSLHIIMANIGLPVCATSSHYKPIKLITSMRTSDSLTDDSSYFFSELTRLKFIVDAIKEESYFIILDEILKGTNSTDKAIGSRKFVEKLVGQRATGIIATHDLSLTEIEADASTSSATRKAAKNYYFDAEIINDELFFDYKLKAGICQNMNASFLLKKMNIVD